MQTIESFFNEIDQVVQKPMVTARFGDNWKQHTKDKFDKGELDVEDIIDIAWKQGRRALLMEDFIRNKCNLNTASITQVPKKYHKSQTIIEPVYDTQAQSSCVDGYKVVGQDNSLPVDLYYGTYAQCLQWQNENCI